MIASLALALGLLGPTDAQGRAEPAAAPLHAAAVRTQETPPEPQSAAPRARQGSGLPRQAPAPRTLRAFWPVFVVVSLAWIGIVGYLLRCGAVLGRVARGVRQLD